MKRKFLPVTRRWFQISEKDLHTVPCLLDLLGAHPFTLDHEFSLKTHRQHSGCPQLWTRLQIPATLGFPSGREMGIMCVSQYLGSIQNIQCPEKGDEVKWWARRGTSVFRCSWCADMIESWSRLLGMTSSPRFLFLKLIIPWDSFIWITVDTFTIRITS